MGERPDQIEQHIRHQRDELGDNFSELEQKVKGAFDWRTQFDEHPGMMLGLAFAGGALIAAVLPGNSSINSRVTSRRRSFNDSYSRYTSRDASQPKETSEADAPTLATYSGYKSAAAQQSSETWDNLKNAAIGVGMARLTEFIEELIPGFAEEYKKAASGKSTTTFGSTPTPQGSWQKPNGGSDYASHS
jgi:hypothetical protein